jgi:mannose-6-phosphate isomerase-like protein (cupin superfamily)
MIEYVGSIEEQTMENTFFRRVLFTGPHSQLVVMCLQPGEAIGDEVHPKVDQFFRIERGDGCAVVPDPCRGYRFDSDEAG